MLQSLLAVSPQLQASWFVLRRFLVRRRVIVIVSDQRLVCCWEDKGRWLWRSGALPPDGIREGQPLQRENMADLLSNILLDCDLVGVQIELVLPTQAVHWRVLDELHPVPFIEGRDLCALTGDLSWPFEPSDGYLALTPCGDKALLVGCPRSQLQAWIDVVDMAELPLRRVDWLVTSALCGLLLNQTDWTGDLAWIFRDGASYRLVVIRSGIPELDCLIQAQPSDILVVELRRRVAAWQIYAGGSLPLAWCLCLPESDQFVLASLLDPDRGESSVGIVASPTLTAWDQKEELQPLELLAFRGMREDIYR